LYRSRKLQQIALRRKILILIQQLRRMAKMAARSRPVEVSRLIVGYRVDLNRARAAGRY
jgi:hypothetical protein